MPSIFSIHNYGSTLSAHSVYPWGILRKPICSNITIRKTCSLVLALCKLHNFCKSRNVSVPQTAENDVTNIVNAGGLLLPRMDNQTALWAYDDVQDRLVALLDGGHQNYNQDDRRGQVFSRHNDLPYKRS